MEQSCPTKLPFIAPLMYFYVRVNTRANNGRCEWIYFSLVGKNMPPHDRNHWHNSQLPLFSTNFTANSNTPWCRRRVALHKCERWRKSDVWEGSDASLPQSLWTEEGSTVNQCGPLSSFVCGHFGCQLCRERRKCFSWKRLEINKDQAEREIERHCSCILLLCCLKLITLQFVILRTRVLADPLKKAYYGRWKIQWKLTDRYYGLVRFREIKFCETLTPTCPWLLQDEDFS